MATVITVSRIGTKPEMRYTTTGRQFWLFRAVDVVDKVYQKDADPIDKWFDCIYFPRDEKEGAKFGSMVETGCLVFLQGILNPKRPYTGQDGVRRQEDQVKVEKWRLLVPAHKKEGDGKPSDDHRQQGGAGGANKPAPSTPAASPAPKQEELPVTQREPSSQAPDDDSDDLPF